MNNIEGLERAKIKKIENTKKKIIEAVEWYKKNRKKASINALSKRARVSRSTIYNYIIKYEEIGNLINQVENTNQKGEEKNKDEIISFLKKENTVLKMENAKLKANSYKEKYEKEVIDNKRLREENKKYKDIIDSLNKQINQY